jgi:hypothetical protein
MHPAVGVPMMLAMMIGRRFHNLTAAVEGGISIDRGGGSLLIWLSLRLEK